jgi:hypothetical protein
VAGLAGGHHTLGVGVAPAGAIALGEQQHVLAERRQMAPAQGAAVGGRLEVLGAAHRPPARLGLLGHPSKHRIATRNGRVSSWAVEHRDERILVETDRYRITGVLRLPRDGYRSRLTDYLNSSDRAFVALTDVEIVPFDGGEAQRRPFLAVSLQHVVLAMPLDGQPIE